MAGLFIVSFLILLKITYRKFPPVDKQSAKQIPLSQDTCSSGSVFMRGKYLRIICHAVDFISVWLEKGLPKESIISSSTTLFIFSYFAHYIRTKERKVLKNLHNQNMSGKYFSLYKYSLKCTFLESIYYIFMWNM